METSNAAAESRPGGDPSSRLCRRRRSPAPAIARRYFRVYARTMAADCYCLVLRNAARKISGVYDACLAPLGITIAQLGMLRKIGRAAPVSITELGRIAGLDRSTTGRNVKVLERMSLVRVAAGSDQREACVALTAQGRRMLKKAAPLWDTAQRKIEAALGQDEVARLCGLLQAL